MIPTAVAEKYQREAVDDLLEHPPKLIVFATSGNSWLRQAQTPPDFPDFLHQFLGRNYDLVGGFLPERQNGRWVEPLPTNGVAEADLLLYRRKPVP